MSDDLFFICLYMSVYFYAIESFLKQHSSGQFWGEGRRGERKHSSGQVETVRLAN